MQIWGVNLGVRGPKSKIEENSFVLFVMENWSPKNGSIPSRNEKEEAMFVTNRHRWTDRQSQWQKVIDSGASCGDQQKEPVSDFFYASIISLTWQCFLLIILTKKRPHSKCWPYVAQGPFPAGGSMHVHTVLTCLLVNLALLHTAYVTYSIMHQ